MIGVTYGLVYSSGWLVQGAIMAVGASQPTVVGTKDGRIGMKNQMQVTSIFYSLVSEKVVSV